ncbi:MAG: hypothetical protein KDA97_10360 [Acidimicrobiales bacterium]|nr:hypothetical protein [Acidimicrobiales bacterium]
MRSVRRMALSAALVAMTTLPVAAPASGGAPWPVVTVETEAGALGPYGDCRNPFETDADPVPARFTVVRNGSTALPLEVDVTYGGTLVNGVDYPMLPDPVVIPAGADRVELEVAMTRNGSADLTVEDGPGYTVGTPARALATIRDASVPFPCNLDDWLVAEMIVVGSAPTDVDAGARWLGLLRPDDFELQGEVPPGLELSWDGSWTGAAAIPGSYEAVALYGTAGLFVERITYRITVENAPTSTTAVPSAPTPAASAPPAAPRTAAPTYAG